MVHDANYYFNGKVYAFVLGRTESNALADTADETAPDAYLGFGFDCRIINTENVTWRVQA